MQMPPIDFEATLWLWPSEKTSWHFLTLPLEAAQSLRFLPCAGFGSIKVEVQLGTSRWQTSVFPSKEKDSYILPVKASVRKKENLEAGDQVHLSIQPLVEI